MIDLEQARAAARRINDHEVGFDTGGFIVAAVTLADFVLSLPTDDGWLPIETAPKDGRFLLLHVSDGLESGNVTVGAYYRCEDRDNNGRFKKGQWDGWLGMDADVLSSWCEPTHWRPLPPPPSKKDQP